MELKKAQTPSELGYRMPAEWDAHKATWLAWPQNEVEWPGKIDAVRWMYAGMIRRLVQGERVRLLVNTAAVERQAREMLTKEGVDTRRVDFLRFRTKRGWMRDTGPIFIKTRGRGGKRAIVHFHFNAWALYGEWQEDRKVPERAARQYGIDLFHARHAGREFVLEGGSIDVNGRGTLLTTEQCLLDQRVQVRNRGLSRSDVEGVLKANLGVKHVVWLGGGVVGDDTHGHVDDICRFVNRRTIVLAQEKNAKDVNYRALAENRERLQSVRLEDGSKPEVVYLPMPGPVRFRGSRLPASYANFYFSNSAVMVPTFNDPNDRIALGIISELITDRPVVGIHAVDLVVGRGTLHCISQQEPV